jgi:transmembrane sensor
MNESLTYFTDLLSRYFSGEASPEEIQSLSEWVAENNENRKLFEDYQKVWELTEKSVIDHYTDLDGEWSALASRLGISGRHENVKIVPLGPTSENTSNRRFGWWKAAAVFLFFLTTSAIAFYLFSKPRTVRITADSGVIMKTLPDGSIITLNKGATIEYASSFAKERHIELKGEAYFEVAHDPSKPLIVSSGNTRVEVLGTKFSVNTRLPDGKMSVALTSGKVSFYFEGNENDKVFLNPGEQAEVSRSSRQIVKSLISDVNYMAWKTQLIIFENTSLSQIINTLGSVYHVKINLADPGLANCRVTATFDHQPIASVLNVLKGTLDLQVQEQDGIFVIYGKACD